MAGGRSHALAAALVLSLSGAWHAAAVGGGHGGGATAVTWGIGGPRVGRPKNSAPTPPAGVEGVRGAVTDVAASGHTALVAAPGVLHTCGRNDSAGGGGHGSPPISDAGQLGRAGELGRLLPVDGGALSGATVTGAACGRYHTAAVTADGRVVTFGLNDVGQLGREGTVARPGGKGCTCDSGGSCECLQFKGAPQRVGDPCFGGGTCRDGVPREVDVGSAATLVAAGRYHTLVALREGGAVGWGLNACAGDNEPKELSDDPELAATPRPLGGSVGSLEVVALSAGYEHIAILTADGALHTCDTGFDGYAGTLASRDHRPNAHNQLGRVASTQEIALAPGLVGGALLGKRVVAAAAGRCHVIAALEDGEVYTFGCKALGRRGSGSEPQRVLGALEGARVTAVGAGEYFTLAATDEGEVYGWGGSNSGQLGAKVPPSEHDPVLVPVTPSGKVSKVLKLAGGYQHAIAAVVP